MSKYGIIKGLPDGMPNGLGFYTDKNGDVWVVLEHEDYAHMNECPLIAARMRDLGEDQKHGGFRYLLDPDVVEYAPFQSMNPVTFKYSLPDGEAWESLIELFNRLTLLTSQFYFSGYVTPLDD